MLFCVFCGNSYLLLSNRCSFNFLFFQLVWFDPFFVCFGVWHVIESHKLFIEVFPILVDSVVENLHVAVFVVIN